MGALINARRMARVRRAVKTLGWRQCVVLMMLSPCCRRAEWRWLGLARPRLVSCRSATRGIPAVYCIVASLLGPTPRTTSSGGLALHSRCRTIVCTLCWRCLLCCAFVALFLLCSCPRVESCRHPPHPRQAQGNITCPQQAFFTPSESLWAPFPNLLCPWVIAHGSFFCLLFTLACTSPQSECDQLSCSLAGHGSLTVHSLVARWPLPVDCQVMRKKITHMCLD